MPGQWLDDPTRRYRKRWHDGTAWTEFVTDDGPASIDPIGAPPPPPPSQPWAYGQPGTYPTYAGAPPLGYIGVAILAIAVVALAADG